MNDQNDTKKPGDERERGAGSTATPLDDPRLTAYVLGELEQTEREAFEKELGSSADVSQLVEEFREIARDVGGALGGEELPALSGDQRARIQAAARGEVEASAASASPPAGGKVIMIGALTALAACALVGISIWIQRGLDEMRDREHGSRTELAKADGKMEERANERGDVSSLASRRAGAESAGASIAATRESGEASYLDRSASAAPGEGLAESRRHSVDALRAHEQSSTNPDSARKQDAKPVADAFALGAEPTTTGSAATPFDLTAASDAAPVSDPVETAPQPVSASVPPAPMLAEPHGGRATADGAAPARPSPGLAVPEGGRVSEAKPGYGRSASGSVVTGTNQGATREAAASAGLSGAVDAKRALAEVSKRRVDARSRGRAETEKLEELEAVREALQSKLKRSAKDLPELVELEAELARRQRFADPTAGEGYEVVPENPFYSVESEPLSTFSIDVDTASYANLRRVITQSRVWPRPGMVRIEEMINYFSYGYEEPAGEHPFSVNVEIAECPWNGKRRLVQIGLKGKSIDFEKRRPGNYVFLLDVSGSMNQPNKLPWVKQSMKLLTENLGENDMISVVVYARSEGVALEPTTGDKKETIYQALDALSAGSGTHGSAGIRLAYQLAAENFIKDGINRVILATDGDFNVGVTNDEDLVSLITGKAKSGVFLSVLGFGTGNTKHSKMEKLADHGNGNYNYIDSLDEARKVLVEEMGGTLVTIAKDVKIQVEFNPKFVGAHRLVGYENRLLQHHEFNDDTKDAGEIGAGHTVTALYEIVPAGSPELTVADGAAGDIDPLKYQKKPDTDEALSEAGTASGEMLSVKLRYKEPAGSESKLIEVPVKDDGRNYGKASADFKFASAVAAFGMTLRNSQYRGTTTLSAILELADEGKGEDASGRRAQFIEIVKQAKAIQDAR